MSIIQDRTSDPIDFESWLAANGCTVTLTDDPDSGYRATLRGPFKDDRGGGWDGPFLASDFYATASTKEGAISRLKQHLSLHEYYAPDTVASFFNLFGWPERAGRFPRFT